MIVKIVRKAKNGNKEAFDELIRYYQNDLYRIAKTRLKQEADIYDAIQETIFSAYKSIGNLSNPSSFKTWLIKILYNECNNIYKKQNRLNSISIDAIEGEKYISPFETLNSNLEFKDIINILSLDEQTILTLFYIEGYKYKEIAKIMNLNENTIKSKILRAKNKIKNNVKEDDIL